MRFATTAAPSYVPPEVYETTKVSLLKRCADLPGLLSIYQLGHVSNPGISDLDLLLVFEHGQSCSMDVRQGLSAQERYVVAHSPFATTFEQLDGMAKYTAFHNYRHLAGKRQDKLESGDASPEVKIQIALEFLVRMYVNLAVQRHFRQLRVRDFLLHAHAIRFDLEFLGQTHGPIVDLTSQVLDWRHRWFTERPTGDLLRSFFVDYCNEFEVFLREQLSAHDLYLPAQAEYRPAPNMRLVQSAELSVETKGLRLPIALEWIPRYRSINHRLCRFVFRCPFMTDGVPGDVERRFEYVESAREYRDRMLPNFELPTSSLRY